MRVFVLEDDPTRIQLLRAAALETDATFAESVDEAIRKFAPPYDVVFLDHDLGGETFVSSAEHNTGAGFCRWLPESSERFNPRVVVHSYNRGGAHEMVATLRDKGYRATWEPFGPTVLGFLSSLASAQSADAVDPHAEVTTE